MSEPRFTLTERGRIRATFAELERVWPALEPGERTAMRETLEQLALELRRCRQSRTVRVQLVGRLAV